MINAWLCHWVNNASTRVFASWWFNVPLLQTCAALLMKWPEIVLFPLFCALVAEEYCDSHQPGPEHKLQFSRVADKKYTVVVPYFMEKKKKVPISHAHSHSLAASFLQRTKRSKTTWKPISLPSHSKFKSSSQGESHKVKTSFRILFSWISKVSWSWRISLGNKRYGCSMYYHDTVKKC